MTNYMWRHYKRLAETAIECDDNLTLFIAAHICAIAALLVAAGFFFGALGFILTLITVLVAISAGCLTVLYHEIVRKNRDEPN